MTLVNKIERWVEAVDFLEKINSLKNRRSRILVIALGVAFLVSCAAPPKKPPHKRLPPEVRKQPVQIPEQKPVPEAIQTNVRPSTAEAATPRRQASMRLTEEGRSLIEKGDFERAEAVLRDAVGVDPSNGIAYFYLAKANAGLGQPDVALGLLEKAEALLGADEEWMGKIADLRGELGAPMSRPVVQSPIDEAF